MPTYEFECDQCADLITEMRSIAARDEPLQCTACGVLRRRIVSGPAVRLSALSKAERADPKYDRMVDRAMRNTSSADPDRLLRRLKPFSSTQDH